MLIRFEKSYLIFMSVCFKSFDISRDFSKTAAIVRNHVVWFNLAIYQSTKRVSDEEQLLRIFCSLYFEMKCNNHKKSIPFFLPGTFSAFTELSYWKKEIIGVVMSFEQ